MLKTSINKYLRIKETLNNTTFYKQSVYNKHFKAGMNEGMTRQEANDYARLVVLSMQNEVCYEPKK